MPLVLLVSLILLIILVSLVRNETDVATIAGLLKLYLRSLNPPLFSFEMFDRIMEISEAYSVTKSVGV
jgi:hypothetical protein